MGDDLDRHRSSERDRERSHRSGADRERSHRSDKDRHRDREHRRERDDSHRRDREGRDVERHSKREHGEREQHRSRDRDAAKSADRDTAKSSDRDKEKERRHRERDDGAPRKRSRSRERAEEPKESSRKRRKEANRDAEAGDAEAEEDAAAQLNLDADITPEEMQMMQAMGIPFGFDTTQGKGAEDDSAKAGAVKVKSTRQARQYMNRRCAAMPFKRNAEIGRVAVVNYGVETGKLVVISDIVDQNRALVDRPDEVRRVINFKRLALTDHRVDIPRLAKKKVLSEALSSADTFSKFEKSAWGQKLAKRQQKTQLTDFERYLNVKSKSKKAAKTRKAFEKLKKDAGIEA